MRMLKFVALVGLAVVSLHCAEPAPAPESAGAQPTEPDEGAPALATEPPAAAEADIPGPAPAIDVDVDSLALKIDPVCKMSLEEYPTTALTEFEGKTYGFCAEICKKKFVAEPEKMLARVAALQEVPAEDEAAAE